MRVLFCLFSCLFLFNTLSAQKVEREKRVDSSEFPSLALDYLDKHFEGRRKVKLYQETSTDSITYEAKLKWNKSRYSVEFFSNGQLMDIEKLINFRDIPSFAKEKITQHWKEHFQKYKITRCQEQTSDKGLRYEIEVNGKDKEGRALYEYLFDEKGAFIQKREILLRTTDMTLY